MNSPSLFAGRPALAGEPVHNAGSVSQVVDARSARVTITLCGEFDVANVPLLRAAFEGLVVGPLTSILVDVAAVSFIDGAAERMLREAERAAARRRVPFQRRGHSHAFARLRR